MDYNESGRGNRGVLTRNSLLRDNSFSASSHRDLLSNYSGYNQIINNTTSSKISTIFDRNKLRMMLLLIAENLQLLPTGFPSPSSSLEGKGNREDTGDMNNSNLTSTGNEKQLKTLAGKYQ